MQLLSQDPILSLSYSMLIKHAYLLLELWKGILFLCSVPTFLLEYEMGQVLEEDVLWDGYQWWASITCHLNYYLGGQLDEKAVDNQHKDYVNLKQVLWHKAVHEILSSIESMTFFGGTMECANGITRTIFSHILIMSADYKEQ